MTVFTCYLLTPCSWPDSPQNSEVRELDYLSLALCFAPLAMADTEQGSGVLSCMDGWLDGQVGGRDAGGWTDGWAGKWEGGEVWVAGWLW